MTPAAPQVKNLDIDFVQVLTKLRVGFYAWDPESGVGKIMVALGDSPGSTSIVDWTLVDDAAMVFSRVASIDIPGSAGVIAFTRYYVSVTAINGAGLMSLWQSASGVMLDPTPPACLQVRPRANAFPNARACGDMQVARVYGDMRLRITPSCPAVSHAQRVRPHHQHRVPA